MKKEIDGVVCRPCDTSSNNSRPARDLTAYINGDTDLMKYFNIQVKKLVLRTADWLGRKGHYHNYAELYFVENGEVTFDLWDRTAGIHQRCVVPAGSLILIPPGVAHRAYGQAGLVMLAMSGAPYRPGSDIDADFGPVGPVPYGLE